MLPSFLKKIIYRTPQIDITEKAEEAIVIDTKEDKPLKEELDLGLQTSSIFSQWKLISLTGILLLTFVLLLSLPSPDQPGISSSAIVDLSSYLETEELIEHTIFLEDFLKDLPIEGYQLDSLSKNATQLGLLTINLGKVLKKYYSTSDSSDLQYISYEPAASHYYLLSIKEPIGVQLIEREAQQLYAAERWVLDEDFLHFASREKEIIPWRVMQQIEPILSWSIGLRNLMKGDTIILVREHMAYDGKIQYGYDEKIVALSLQSSAVDTTILAFLFQNKDYTSFYDYEGRPWERKFLTSPVKYARISSRYNLIRLHPILKKVKPHFGNDFAAPMGEKVLALADGKIVNKEKRGGNGNYIKIEHDEIYTTAYLHLSAYREGLQVGDMVRQGEVIGYVGASGSATGPHVCLRFWRREYQDDFVKAFPYLPKPAPLPRDGRRKFFQKRDTLLQIMREVL